MAPHNSTCAVKQSNKNNKGKKNCVSKVVKIGAHSYKNVTFNKAYIIRYIKMCRCNIINTVEN